MNFRIPIILHSYFWLLFIFVSSLISLWYKNIHFIIILNLKNSLMIQIMVYLSISFLWTWKENESKCCYMDYSFHYVSITSNRSIVLLRSNLSIQIFHTFNLAITLSVSLKSLAITVELSISTLNSLNFASFRVALFSQSFNYFIII